ncbi:hypothetical protein FRACYDRAFT_251843 [Fragilariopsis cylindrus CCMP1102]|uniref:Uncharacterized protein n=1 Tax=Fragilariopsis cylindrus CCMP1102 TaxID=635003 RepID=A0A1E7EMF1_9STRA|nr:hypothetical protein FRACYDRAFT_251843 [Fragilariopsis cylindrus CCMP1102]|eukprot:OEU07108.1 hypothetical protein FRACYDRAFT_251843 [Fragilariopsis cylindrus CCMP1102]
MIAVACERIVSYKKAVMQCNELLHSHHFFNETHGLGFKISTGSRFLGGFIGDTTSRDEYVSTKIADWIHGTKELAAVARLKHPHAAYTGITKCLQHKWSFTQRVIPGIDDLFQPLEDELTNNLLPALFGDPPSTMDDKLRLLTALPVKHAGLALPNPVTSSATNYKNSTLMSSHLLLAVQGKINFSLQDHRDTCQSSLSASRELRQTENDSSLTNLLAALPLAAAGQPSTTRAINRASETGLWLTTIPNHINAIDKNGDRGDLLIKGFWDNGMDAIIDVRITDTDAKSYRTRDPKKVLQSQEKEKKKKYLDQCLLQRRAFTPFVVSVDGLIGYEASNVLKQLSKRLADKWNKPYSVTCGIVRSRISIACARASNQCLRGSRIPFKTMSRQIQWEDGAGAGLYRIVR